MSVANGVLRFAFVGCGSVARHHFKALQANSLGACVSAAIDIRKESAIKFTACLPRSHECEVFTSLSDCLKWGGFDVAVIMVPHHLHESCATDCLRAGKHVLLEKPLAHSLPSCLRLLKIAEEEVESVFMIGEQSPYWPEVVKAGELIKAGVIGTPFFAKANYWESVGNSFEVFDGQFDDGGENWRFDREKVGGGCLVDGATHWIRPLRRWFGEIDEAVGVVGYPVKNSSGETLASALLKFKNGFTASLYCQFNDIPMSQLPFFQIFGDKGEITIDGNFKGGMSVITRDNPKGQRFDNLGGYFGGFGPQMRAFLAAIATGTKDISSCSEALGEMLVARAIEKSIDSKQWEKVDVKNLNI